MKIPQNGRKKALIIVDVQPAFVKKKHKNVIKNIQQLLESAKYDLYIEALFHAEKGGLWDIQQKWICPKDENFFTMKEVTLPKCIRVVKQTKSAFKGKPNLLKVLLKNNIKEVHIIGLDTNDCVMATALESFDSGFLTYVIEECCGASSSDKLHREAISLLRHQNMTNNSII